MHHVHTLQNWLSYVQLAIFALTFSAASFAELQRLRACNRKLAAENEALRKQVEDEVQKYEACDRSYGKHIAESLETLEQVCELKRVNENLVEISRVQQLLLDQSTDNAEELGKCRESSRVNLFKIEHYKQRAECAEKATAESHAVDNGHAAERMSWKKQVAELEELNQTAASKILELERNSRENSKSGRQTEKELKSSQTKVKSLQSQLEVQRKENARLYPLRSQLLQLEEAAEHASAKISQLEEVNQRLTARQNQQVQEHAAREALIQKRIVVVKTHYKEVSTARIRDHEARTKKACDEKVKTAERNEAKAQRNSFIEIQESRRLSKVIEALKAKLPHDLANNDDKPMETEHLGDDEDAEKYMASFALKVCEVISRAMARGIMDFDPNLFLKTLGDWRDCYKKHEPDSTTGNDGEISGGNEGNKADSGGGDGGNGYVSDESEL